MTIRGTARVHGERPRGTLPERAYEAERMKSNGADSMKLAIVFAVSPSTITKWCAAVRDERRGR